MEVTGETCTLCLKYVQDTNFITLDETILGKLSFLQMDLDQTMEESESLCKECEKKIEHAFEFKSCLVNTESCLVPYLTNDRSQKINIRLIIEKDGPSTSKIEASVDKEVCRLCKKLVNTTSVISLAKVLKDDSIMDVFHGHIPEMDLDVTENPTVCVTCQQSLSHFSTLIGSWSIAKSWNDNDEDMKEDYNDFKVEVKNEKLDDVSDSNTNSSSSMLETENSVKTPNEIDINIKTESPPFTGDVFVSNKQIKKEEPESDTAIREVHLESEEVDIKDEEGFRLCNGKNGVKKTFQCKDCSFRTTFKLAMSNHLSQHSIYSVSYSCEACQYETTSTSHIKRHLLRHKSDNELAMHRCTECPYRTKHRANLSHHNVIHKHPEDIFMYKCDSCSYQSKKKYLLDRHELVHKKGSEVEMYCCSSCAYTTKRKSDLSKHSVIHKVPEECCLYKCTTCNYESIRKRNMDVHLLTHKNADELEMFVCSECHFTTKYKSSLHQHVVGHKAPDEIRYFRCDLCPYKSRKRYGLKRHIGVHTKQEVKLS